MSVLRVAHRGAPDEAPENTRAAFRAALRLSVDGVELDVRFSRDHFPVVHHDETLGRTAGRPERVADLDRNDLLGIDVGSRFDPAFSGETIPSLAEALDVIGSDVRAFVEVKDGPDLSPESALHLAREIREGADRNSLMLVSVHVPVLLHMKDEIAHLRTALVRADPGPDPVEDLTASRASMLFLRHDGVTEDLVSFCALAGYPVIAWTVDDAVEMERVLDCGVAGVVSNHPGLFVDE